MSRFSSLFTAAMVAVFAIAYAQDASMAPMDITAAPPASGFSAPSQCNRRILRSVGSCACYLLVTRQVRSNMQSTSIAQCRAEFGNNQAIFRLGNSCRRFITGALTINTTSLSMAGTNYIRTCVDPSTADVTYTAADPVATPTPSVTLLSRQCSSRRFVNIISCACYLVLTRQVESSDRRTTISRCRSVLGANRFINGGAIRCRKFVRRMNTGIFIRRLAFQKNLYVRTCLDADAEAVEYTLPAAM